MIEETLEEDLSKFLSMKWKDIVTWKIMMDMMIVLWLIIRKKQLEDSKNLMEMEERHEQLKGIVNMKQTF